MRDPEFTSADARLFFLIWRAIEAPLLILCAQVIIITHSYGDTKGTFRQPKSARNNVPQAYAISRTD